MINRLRKKFILGLPTNALNKIFMKLHEELDNEHYLTSLQAVLLKKKGNARFPDDEETFSALKEKDVYSIKAKNRIYFLEQLENYNNREIVKIEGNPDLSIEHIFPQAPHPQWRKDLDETDFREMQKRYLHTIANLTLSGNNGALGNKAFADKRDMNVDNREQGYKYSRLWLNRFLAEQEQWNIKILEKRFKLIAERFTNIWQYPDLELPDDTSTGEINIFDAEDPTHKKLDYSIFMDEKVPVRTVSEMYLYVLQRLFELSPDLFFHTDLAEKLEITKEKGKLRDAARLDEIYY